jgi:peptidoglycan lytic transglycosylase G
MSDNAGGWPPVTPGAPGSQAPQGFPRPLPPGYEPVHHESPPTDPRFADRRRAEDSPWRRAERVSHPEAASWRAGGPVPASYDGDPRGLDDGQFYSPGQDGGRDDDGQYRDPGPADRYDGLDVYGQYQDDDGYDTGDRFVPGFADDGDGDGDDDGGGRGARRRPARRSDSRGQGPAGPRGPRRRRWRWIAPLAALLIILIPLAVGGAYAYSLYMSKYHPADYSGSGTGHVVVQVSSGDTPTSLAPKLQQLGVVASARAFVLAAEHSSNPNGLLPGFYGMHEHMKASLAYALLLNPKNLVQITVTIPEGWRLSQVVGWLGRKSGIPASAYDQVLKDPGRLGLPSYAGGKPEGYLFPATYEVVPHETALGVLSGMVQRFDQEAAAVNLPAAARQVHLTQGQVIIMASLVQAEGGRLSDYPKIARVIYNRLAQGIPLQLDSTVLYGLNRYGILATDAQLASDSPYNTYKHTGLTPGPIDNPGNAAIQAVLHPASGNWLYFVTVNPKTGETLFTASQAQFQQYRNELEQNLGQGGTGG